MSCCPLSLPAHCPLGFCTRPPRICSSHIPPNRSSSRPLMSLSGPINVSDFCLCLLVSTHSVHYPSLDQIRHPYYCFYYHPHPSTTTPTHQSPPLPHQSCINDASLSHQSPIPTPSIINHPSLLLQSIITHQSIINRLSLLINHPVQPHYSSFLSLPCLCSLAPDPLSHLWGPPNGHHVHPHPSFSFPMRSHGEEGTPTTPLLLGSGAGDSGLQGPRTEFLPHVGCFKPSEPQNAYRG